MEKSPAEAGLFSASEEPFEDKLTKMCDSASRIPANLPI